MDDVEADIYAGLNPVPQHPYRCLVLQRWPR